MTGGIIQLVGYGYENMYLTNNPQVTFFKVVYRRYTNFSIEQIPQYFIGTPNFGDTYTCNVSKRADLIGETHLVVTLPQVIKSSDPNVQFAWVKRIGFALIKSVEIEINGKIIDTHYGEWLNLWAELTGKMRGDLSRGYNIMIGNVPEMTNFSSSKNGYILYIPLQFWFCRSSGSALPLISLQYCDIKINVEFQDAEKCYITTPTHYIQCIDDIVNFIPYEYIEQNINGITSAGIFINYDIVTRRLYYTKLTDQKLMSIQVSSSFNTSNINQTAINTLLNSPMGLQYAITGKTSGFSTYAQFNNNSLIYPSTKLRNFNFTDCFLLINYYYLDDDERYKFAESKHDYIIEQLIYTPSTTIDSVSANPFIIADHPTKLMVWVVQFDYLAKYGDYYNYTDSYQYKKFPEDISNNPIGFPMGQSLIKNQTILFNGNPRLTFRNASYFDTIQPYQYTKTTPIPGINMFSFCISPFTLQPTGSCNMSQVDNLRARLQLSSKINITNTASFRSYQVTYQILRFTNGLVGKVFT
jgi:hypothetical protein